MAQTKDASVIASQLSSLFGIVNSSRQFIWPCFLSVDIFWFYGYCEGPVLQNFFIWNQMIRSGQPGTWGVHLRCEELSYAKQLGLWCVLTIFTVLCLDTPGSRKISPSEPCVSLEYLEGQIQHYRRRLVFTITGPTSLPLGILSAFVIFLFWVKLSQTVKQTDRTTYVLKYWHLV